MYSFQAAPNNNLAHRAPQGPAAAAATASGDPEAAPYNSVYGDESRGKLHPHPHHHSHHHHPHSAFGGGVGLGLPPALDAHSLDKLKSQALAKARAVQSSLIAAVKSSGSAGGVVGGFGAGGVSTFSAASGGVSSHGGFGVVVPPAAGTGPARPATALSAFTAKLGRLCDKVESSRATALACRACVASYFVHLVAEDLRAWWTVRPTTAAAAANAAMGHPRALAFPLVSTLVVLPSALAVVAGKFVAPAATFLAAEMLWKSTRLLYIQFLLVFSHGRAPSELLAKKVAMCGVAALVAAHPVASGAGGEAEGTGRKSRRRRGGDGIDDISVPSSSSSAAPGKSNSFAGPLIDSAARRLEAAGIGRSALLLAGRLLVCALLLSGGLAQLRRVSARGWRPWRRWAAPSSVAFEDGHDNNFLLVELALALPFALGWRVPEVTRMLAGTLFAEAAVCWPVWRHWPNPHFAAHVRSHFFCNVGVAAGLLLTRSLGGGVFAADRVVGRKKSR